MSSSIVLKGFTNLADIPPALWQAVVIARQRYLFPAEGNTLDDYRLSDARSVHFIAESGDQLAGFVQYDPELNRLRQLLVLPDFRGKAIGEMLVIKVAEESKARRHKALHVNAWAVSQGFYAKAGFVPIGKPYHSNGVLCQKMKRPLSSRY